MTLSYIFATFICWINCCRVIMLIIAGYLMQHKFLFREFPLKLTNTQNKLQECLPLNQCFLFSFLSNVLSSAFIVMFVSFSVVLYRVYT